MLAIIAAIILVLAAFNVTIGTVNLVWLALAFWALHHGIGHVIPIWRGHRHSHPNG